MPLLTRDAMEPVESRSDVRHRLIAASPARVFAAMSDPERVARWWGPAGFTNTIHQYEFVEGGTWLLTMHGPDGRNYPNESRFTRIVRDQLFEIEHLNGHHFLLTLELHPQGEGTDVTWRQTFDTIEHYKAAGGVRRCSQRAESRPPRRRSSPGKSAA